MSSVNNTFKQWPMGCGPLGAERALTNVTIKIQSEKL